MLSTTGGLAVRVISRQQLQRLAMSSLPIAELEIQSDERREFVWSPTSMHCRLILVLRNGCLCNVADK